MGVAILGGTVVLLSYGLPAAIRRGAAPVTAKPELENVAARATVADNHARLSTVPVDDIDRVQQQLAAFVSSGQLPEVSLAEIPDLGFAIDDSTFEGDALTALAEVTGDLAADEPQLAHLGPSLTSLVGGGGGGFGGGGGAGSAGVAGRGTTEYSASEGANEQGVQSIDERDDRGESNGGGRAENSGTSSTGNSNGDNGSGPANNGSASNGSASNGSATNGPAGGVTTPTSSGAPAGGSSGLGRVGGVSGGTVAQVPEPSSMLLIGLGLVGAAATRRRQPAR